MTAFCTKLKRKPAKQGSVAGRPAKHGSEAGRLLSLLLQVADRAKRVPNGSLRVLNAPAGAWQSIETPVGHTAGVPRPPDFGAPRFSPDEQAAHPDQPMTRLVKDVLRAPEKLRAGIDPQTGKPLIWPVQQSDLRELEDTFAKATASGHAFNLTLSHGDRQTGIVPTDELVTPIDAVKVDGGTLWIAVYVTPEQAKFLQNPAMKVSVGVWDNWTDGRGVRYKQALIHVAVTDHPAMPGQGPFRQLANVQKGNAMDFPKLIGMINSMLPGELSLPEDTTEENLIERLELVLMVLAGGTPVADAEGSTDTAGEGEGDVAAAASTSQEPKLANLIAGVKDPALAGVLTGFGTMFKTLTNEITALRTERTSSNKAAFTERVKALCAAGLAPAEGTKLLSLGQKFNYDLDLLTGVEAARAGLPAKGGKGVARTLANAQAPGVATTGETPAAATDAEIKHRLKDRGIDPEKYFPRIAQR